MKIIEGLKGLKVLRKRQVDLVRKLEQNSALPEELDPPYGDLQEKMVSQWLGDVENLGQEIMSISIRLQKTNLETEVTIELQDVEVTHTIAEWILRRRYLAKNDLEAWNALTDRNLKGTITRFFKPELRDAKVVALSEEAAIIDVKLETVNAITDILD